MYGLEKRLNIHQARAHNMRHGYDVGEFLESYRLLLQQVVDEVWA
jgi:hypothetical protein